MVTAVFWKGSLDVLLHTCIIIVISANICVNKCFGVVHFLLVPFCNYIGLDYLYLCFCTINIYFLLLLVCCNI